MVNNVSSLTRNGLLDWIIQRVSAVFIAIYIFYLLIYCWTTPGMDFYTWQALFQNTWMRTFTLIFLLMLILHAWIGVWTIITDYLKNTTIRLLSQWVVIFALLGFFIWGVEILWGV